MELNREKLKRMFEDTKNNGGSTNGGGGGGALAGYATQAWVNEGFVSIDFFNRLFTVYGPGETSIDTDVVVAPNDLDSTIKNIKAMFGLWTEQYLSALGLNPGGTGSATSLSMLDDVDITSPTNGQALVYNATSLKWENQTISTVTALANLTDVLLTSPAANQVLVYDGTQWVNSSVKTVNGYSIFGTGDIPASGGGTGNYVSKTGDSMTGYLSINISQTSPTGDTPLGLSSHKDATYIAFRKDSVTSGYIGVGSDKKPYFYDTENREIITSAGGVITGTLQVQSVIIRDTNAIDAVSGALYLNWRSLLPVIIGNDYKGSTYMFQVKENSYLGKGALIGDNHSNNNGGIWVGANYNGDNSLGYDCIERNVNGKELYIQYFNSGSVSLCNGGGNVAIGAYNKSYKLYVAGTIYATGGITALSDIRKKNIQNYMQLGVDEVANAPIIKFTWKEQTAENKGLHVGSIAQYWEKVLPEAVKRDKDGTLSMSYGVVALVAAISTAKKVQEHERRIAELERENQRLKEMLNVV